MVDTVLVNDFQPLQKKSTLSDVVSAQFELGLKTAETGSIMKMIDLEKAERTDDVTDPLTLNKMFPDVDVSFNEPTSLAKAELINKNAQERRRLQHVIANGDDSFTTTALGMAAGFAAQMIDPIGIAAGIATAGVAKGAGIYKAMAKTYLGRSVLARNIAEGVVGNVVSEAAFVIPGQIANREDINAYENITNAVVGGMAFPVVAAAARKAFGYIKNFNSSEQFEKTFAMTEARMEAGKTPHLSQEEIQLVDRSEVSADSMDPVELRKKVNSEDQGMYYDPEITDKLETIDEVADISDIVIHAEERFNEIETNAFGNKLEDSDLAEVKEIRAQSQKEIQINDEVMRMATACVRGI